MGLGAVPNMQAQRPAELELKGLGARGTCSCTPISQAAPAGGNPLVSQSCFLGPKVTGPAHVAGGYGGFEGQETEQRPPSPVRLGSKLQESKMLGLVPCR